ncbi:DUF6549 family protein [Flavobacterium sp.]|uniref:DUF6549 family protein n=1 Tax=Flavobacterium sp. TaxID=239 RepID=UPI003D6AC11E
MQINLSTLKDRAVRVIPSILLIVALCYLFQTCESNKSYKAALSASQEETKHLKNQLGRITASHEVIVFQNKAQQKQLIEKDAELKAMANEFANVKSTVKIMTITKFDTIRQTFEVPVPFDFERIGSIENEWYNLGYKINQNGLEIEPFQTWTDINVVTGFKKKWFLGKKYYTTDVTATNPFIAIPEVKSTEVQIPVKWYETTLFKIGVGVIGGYLIAK